MFLNGNDDALIAMQPTSKLYRNRSHSKCPFICDLFELLCVYNKTFDRASNAIILHDCGSTHRGAAPITSAAVEPYRCVPKDHDPKTIASAHQARIDTPRTTSVRPTLISDVDIM